MSDTRAIRPVRSIPLHGVQLLQTAYLMRDQAQADKERKGEKALPQDALAAIIVAAAAAEAFINELPVLLRLFPREERSVIACADALEEIEEDRGSVTLKYQVAARMLSGTTFPKGENPFQPFSHLIRVRNEIMHIKPAWSDEDSRLAKLVDALSQRGLALPSTEGFAPSPVNRLLDPRTANWACVSAHEMMRATLELVPAASQHGILIGIKNQLGTGFHFQLWK